MELLAGREEFAQKEERNLYYFYENGSKYELSGSEEYEKHIAKNFNNKEEFVVPSFSPADILEEGEPDYIDLNWLIKEQPYEKQDQNWLFLNKELNQEKRMDWPLDDKQYNETSLSNLYSGGIVAGNDLWIFYGGKDGIYQEPTFSVRNSKEKINNMRYASSFYIYDDWLYFVASNNLYRCRFDGSEMSNYACSVMDPQYIEDMVYFRIGSSIYKMNLEEGVNHLIFEYPKFGQFIYMPEEEAIYFLYPTEIANHGYVCKTYLGTNNTYKIYDKVVSKLIYQDGYFYYFNSEDGHIYKANQDFSEVKEAVNLYAYSYNVYEDGIIATDGFEKLYKMDLEGNNQVLLDEGLYIIVDSLHVVGENIYFEMYTDKVELYRINMDGRLKTQHFDSLQ